jgi:Skp family chaperone for outer membrane proteins
MRRRRIAQEMLIAVGVAAGVIAIGFMVLLAAGPTLRRPSGVPNVCVLDRVLVFEGSVIGKSANAQLLKIKERDQEAINNEKRRIDSTAIVSVPDARMSQLLQQVQKENARLETIRGHARTLVIQKLTKTIRQESAAAGCYIIVDRQAIVDLGEAKDITAALIKAIDKNVPPLPPGTLEQLPINQG